jgi:hypothetical protein
MKKILLICFTFIVGCSSIQQKASFQKIIYKAITRGYSTDILIQENTLKYFKNTKEKGSLSLTKKIKDSLNSLLKKIEFKTINDLKAPSNKYQYDGAMYATLEIVWNGETFVSSGFDHDNPPKELIPLINYLLTLIQ